MPGVGQLAEGVRNADTPGCRSTEAKASLHQLAVGRFIAGDIAQASAGGADAALCTVRLQVDLGRALGQIQITMMSGLSRLRAHANLKNAYPHNLPVSILTVVFSPTGRLCG